jgi:signal transduction histidine kinase
VQFLFDEPMILVRGDANRLHQMVWNLISNAIKFTPSGGYVQIQLTRVGDDVELHVSDNGLGSKLSFYRMFLTAFAKQIAHLQGLTVV